MAADIAILALFNLSGGEVILILALILVLFGSKKLPALARGLGRGIIEFRRGAREVRDELDESALGAGESLGGIYGKGAAEAITPDNQVAELYDPAVFQGEESPRRERKGRILRIWKWLQTRIEGFLSKRAR